MTRAALVALVAALALVLAPVGAAGAAPAAQGEGATTAVATGDEQPAKQGEAGVPSVPFTGTDAIALVAVALSLVAAGFALRRLSTR